MPHELAQFVESWGQPRVVVVGDLMLDRYVWGDAQRVSQEAPVLLLRAADREDRLGGAAGAAAMAAALGGGVQLVGAVGDDAAGRRITELLAAHQIEAGGVATVAGGQTTLKERYIGRAAGRHPQQVLRVDYEQAEPPPQDILDRLQESALAALADCEAVLLSDYAKGAAPESLARAVIEEAGRRGVAVIVDPPRGVDYERYRGATALTPNRTETADFVGRPIDSHAAAGQAAEEIRDRLDLAAAVITLDRDGVMLAVGDAPPQHFPVNRRNVYDITGAGDTVAATLACAVAAGGDWATAVQLANAAAGLQVERFGSSPVRREELLAELARRDTQRQAALIGPDALAARLDEHRRAGQKIVFTNGVFDLLHAGHIYSLEEARRQGDVLVVGLNSDASVRRLGKGPDRPIYEELRRATVLSALACVDYVCLFDEDTPESLIRRLRPEVLVKGADYRPEQVAGWQFVQSYGGRLHLVELQGEDSTTGTLDRIRGRLSEEGAGG